MAEDQRPADDPSIPPDELLYLRVYPGGDALYPIEGGHRPTSGGVKGRDMDEPLSVDLGSICTPGQTRNRGTDGNFHVASFTAAMVRGIGLRIRRAPVVAPDPNPNPAHALIYGTRKDAVDNLIGGLTGGEYGRIARFARIIEYAVPPQPDQPAAAPG
jgi:hypothetical protein